MTADYEKQLVVNDVNSILVEVHKAFEAALRDILTSYFEGRPVNIQTVPDLLRDKVKYLLETNPQYKKQYELQDLSRNGLSLICKGSYYRTYIIKILYSPDGKLPVKGMKGEKKRLLCQRYQPMLLQCGDIRSIHSLKNSSQETLVLVILWRAKFVNGIAHQDLLLVRPIEGENSQPMIYWNDPIKEPASTKEEVNPDPYTDDLDDDLGISFDVS